MDKLKHLSTPGNIITFKEPASKQVIVNQLVIDRHGARLIGMYINSPIFDTVEALIEAVDWSFVEGAIFKDYSNL